MPPSRYAALLAGVILAGGISIFLATAAGLPLVALDLVALVLSLALRRRT